MKKILLSATALTLLFASCKKDDDKGAGNSWTLNGTNYGVSTTQRTATSLTATSGGTSTVMFMFDALPTTSGTYVIGGTGANSMDILASTLNGTTPSLYSNTSVTANATVTVNGGKITINTPEIWVEGMSDDSVKFSANVIEN